MSSLASPSAQECLFKLYFNKMAFVDDSNVVIMFSTNVYKRITASQLLAPVNLYSRGVATISSKWLPYSIIEQNEVNYNTPDMDMGLQFIKKK